ncbi:hypothetical protein DDB_G0279025 [Dictyostelium discoideum AX4]|uniref:Uncharacterized protein n=1 Tax=Dictyostelium discoideum TaxID=44689 RepID=Q54XD6_DICDI|nr:hypothetical protein DDB_G0279025 [Dictyostelium discoideum AX4]EAL67934.1 hypothetical protein DDB_G0279025 [Dictyostelium discoideum AX4]|eukprot:XP_641925.1 hypothetical protein DDB_G0279025 [Dictyostelium discoideum AX4]
MIKHCINIQSEKLGFKNKLHFYQKTMFYKGKSNLIFNWKKNV